MAWRPVKLPSDMNDFVLFRRDGIRIWRSSADEVKAAISVGVGQYLNLVSVDKKKLQIDIRNYCMSPA